MTSVADPDADRRRRITPTASLALSVAILATISLTLVVSGPNLGGHLDVDRSLYMSATARWLAGGPFYLPYQLAGPYPVLAGDILYPPVVLWLFVPLRVLPAVLWWAIPFGLTAWVVWRLRPSHVVWPLLALCVAWPTTVVKVGTGNPVIWAMAAMALGVVTAGPAVFALIKPSLFPFALWGANRRQWWAALVAFVAISLPFGTLWTDWLAAIGNSRGGGLLYSILEAPMIALPVIAWLGRRR